jgi:hypothetical protein
MARLDSVRGLWLMLAALLAISLLVSTAIEIVESPVEQPTSRLNGPSTPPLAVVATYRGVAVHRDDPERLELTDRLQIPNSSFDRTPWQFQSLARADPFPKEESSEGKRG